jgi:hypothetical protein
MASSSTSCARLVRRSGRSPWTIRPGGPRTKPSWSGGPFPGRWPTNGPMRPIRTAPLWPRVIQRRWNPCFRARAELRAGDELQQHDGAPAFSAAAACAPRLSRGTPEHACVNGRGSLSHQRFDCADRPVAVARDVLGHEGRDDTSSSLGLKWFHGVCPVDTRRGTRRHTPPPFLATIRYFFPAPREENSWSGPQARRKRCWRAISGLAE